jgi:hypothetical protein
MDSGILLDDCLRPVSVMHVPVNDQNPLEPVAGLRISRGKTDIPEQAESHCAASEGMMTGRTDGTEGPWRNAFDSAVYSIEHAAGAGGCRIP